MTVKITGMRAKRRHANGHGSQPVAEFDFITPDIGMKGCILVSQPGGRWKTWVPTVDIEAARAQRETDKAVYWRAEGTLQKDVTAAAVRSYKLLELDVFEEVDDDDKGVLRTLGEAA